MNLTPLNADPMTIHLAHLHARGLTLRTAEPRRRRRRRDRPPTPAPAAPAVRRPSLQLHPV